MQANVAGLDQQDHRRGRQQPKRGRDGMNVHNFGHGRLLVQVVVQIKAEAHADEDPKDREPDQRGPAIFTRRPGCG